MSRKPFSLNCYYMHTLEEEGRLCTNREENNVTSSTHAHSKIIMLRLI